MLILDRYRLGTIVSQRRMIFLATDSTSGRPVWVHVIAEPVDAARAELVRRAQAFIQAAGGQDIEDFLEYGYHDKTHYVITASRPECKELGPYLDTLLALRGIEVPNKSASLEATASGAIADDRTQEITARLRRVGDSAASGAKAAGAPAAATRHAQVPPQERTMSSQPTMYLRPDDVRQAIESGGYPQQAAESPAAPLVDGPRIVDNPDDTKTTIRFVRPQFAASASGDAVDPDQTAKVVSPWAARRAEARQRADRPPPRPVPVPSQPPEKPPARKYPVWEEKARPAAVSSAPAQAPPAAVAPEPQVHAAGPAEPVPHRNGSGAHRLVLPPVRRGQPAVPAASAPPAEFDLAPPAAAPHGWSDPKLLYMTLALVMVSLATIALGLGWYIHSTAILPAPQGVAVAPATAGGGAEAPGAAQSGARAPAAAAQPAPQQPGGASFSPLLLSIAFISAVLIFAAVVVLFMAVKRGS